MSRKSLGRYKIVGDPDQLHQVILNLLLNAQQAMESWQGQKAISVLTLHDPESDTVRVVVADTGPGIPASAHDQIFQPFFTTRQSGVGIGLAFCRRVMEAHGGRIQLEDCPSGATFTILLPVRR